MNVYFVVCTLCLTSALDLDARIVITILSQSNQYHLEKAQLLKNDIRTQADKLNLEPPVIHLSHLDFPHVGGWTVLPLVPHLINLHRDNSSWVFFVEDRTEVEFEGLINLLKKYDYNKELFLGYSLTDQEATIIHHFAFFDNPQQFKYPNTASGFAISNFLLRRLADRLKEHPAELDFSIDPAHELALYVWDKGAGPTLTHDPALCISKNPGCATHPRSFSTCGKAAPKGTIYFAVKTCEKFHDDRVSVVKSTWAEHASAINFFSDVEDERIPTVTLGIPNTERGHCSKTMAILKHVRKKIGEELKHIQWIVVVDDDTILSVRRLQELLSCYDAATSVALGERYGYNVYNPQGYNYLTGGGGIVLSKVLLEQLSDPEVCDCPSDSSPDDMFLGLCIARLGVDVTHSSAFHQARPEDYSSDYLETQSSVSFHKHWMIDPISVYKKWFYEVDAHRHDEL